jgi:Putative Actinobacterial Holin-X, holin superfamily III
LATKEPTGNPQDIAAALTEVTERAQAIVREEIELAKAEVTTKLARIARGAAVGAIAGIFVIAALVLILQGFAWLAYYLLPGIGNFAYFWGFFVVAVILLILGGIAGYLAARFFKAGSPPTPKMAIEEAQRIRESVQKAS